jgi:hypothetical protein
MASTCATARERVPDMRVNIMGAVQVSPLKGDQNSAQRVLTQSLALPGASYTGWMQLRLGNDPRRN